MMAQRLSLPGRPVPKGPKGPRGLDSERIPNSRSRQWQGPAIASLWPHMTTKRRAKWCLSPRDGW